MTKWSTLSYGAGEEVPTLSIPTEKVCWVKKGLAMRGRSCEDVEIDRL